MEHNPSLKQFYKGKSILITGATGFLGKVLLYRLLSLFPQINKIYILIRCQVIHFLINEVIFKG